MKELIVKFRAELELLNYSPQTIKYYISIADQFLEYTKKRGNYDRQDVLSFLQAMSHLDQSSKAIYKQVLRRFFEFMEIPWPLKKRELMTQSKMLSPDTSLTEDEVNKIFEAAKSDSLTYAVIRTLAVVGIRRSELCDLNRKDFNSPYLTISMLKGEGIRTMTLDEETIKAINDYLKKRNDDDPSLFFNTRTKSRISPQSVTNLTKSTMYKVGIIRKGLGAHAFRRALATSLSERQTHPLAIQRYMGWKTQAMVDRYSRVKQPWVEEQVLKKHYLFS